MPYLDGTGPMGLGPRTGRGLGPCGRGRGYGVFGYGFRRYVSPKNELNALEEEIKILEEKLKALKEEKEMLEKELKERK